MTARLIRINCSNGGVPKLPVEEALVTSDGIAGDEQRDRRFHGGPNRAVSMYSADLIEQLATEGHQVHPGALGENLTLEGLRWIDLRPGVRLSVGVVSLEVTSFAAPCRTIRRSFLGEDFTRISQKLHPGWSRVYARVLTQGVIRVGDL